MTTYEVERPDDPEHGIRVACPEHGEDQEFPPGERRVAFHCSECEFEIEIQLHNTTDWRELSEWC